MMKYPIGIQSFEKLRKGGFVYVDKTELVYDLVTTGAIYFLTLSEPSPTFRKESVGQHIGMLLPRPKRTFSRIGYRSIGTGLV